MGNGWDDLCDWGLECYNNKCYKVTDKLGAECGDEIHVLCDGCSYGDFDYFSTPCYDHVCIYNYGKKGLYCELAKN